MDNNGQNLEQKMSFLNLLRNNIAHKVIVSGISLLISSGALYVNGCGGDESKPFRYCCEAKKCSTQHDEYGSNLVCDGDGDNCYCRANTCCERKQCESAGMSCAPGFEGCYCKAPVER